MASLLRKEDEKCADIVSSYLEDTFYSEVEDFKRINEKEMQFKGIDVIFNINNVKYVCDEKAAIRYVNKPLNTFAMELSFIDRSNMLHEGWLLDTSKVNNSFLFVWIDRATKNILESKEDLIELEYCLIKKEAILDYLSELGWSQEKLLQKSTFIRENKFENLGNITKNGCKFSYSPKLFEKPVNILISRDKLREISVLNRRIVNGD